MAKLPIILLILYFSLPLITLSQRIENPSFEGLTGAGVSPPGWGPCATYSTPDTQPGYWEVKTAPSDGNSYLGLITRGDLGPYAKTTEDIQARLNNPLLSGKCYSFSIDLAFSEDFGHTIDFTNWLSYDKPVILRIWGGDNYCNKTELLGVSEPIDHLYWKNYEFILKPQTDFEYLTLEAYYTSLPEYFGNILLDKIKIDDLPEYFLIVDTVVEYGAELLLSASEGQSYSWMPSGCMNCQSINTIIKESTIFTVVVTDQNGCSFTEEFIIWLEIIIPNVFTPNSDGENELFKIQGLRANSRLTIYNRWGKIVFESKDYQNDWQGLTKTEKKIPDGIYYYILQIPELQKEFAGAIQLLR